MSSRRGYRRTDAVFLAPAARRDAEDLIRSNRESRALHIPWAHPFVDQAGFEKWFDSLRGSANVGLVAREYPTGKLVGVINLNQIVLGNFRSAYLGYYASAAMAGHGLMTQAMRLALDVAAGDIGLHRVEANIQPDNVRSIALVKRLGFRLEGFSPRYLRIDGVWRDHERWALVLDGAPDDA